jgi:hypothetical protein
MNEENYEQVRGVVNQLAAQGAKGFVVGKRDGRNIKITRQELKDIRSLKDFDLTMLLSEIDEFGWVTSDNPEIGGRALLVTIKKTVK